MNPTSTTPFFIAHGQEQKGPYPFSEVKRMLATGQVQPANLCWTDGMSGWQPLQSVLPAPRPELDLEPEGFNPYAPPKAIQSSYSARKSLAGRYYGGIRRGAYFGLNFVLGVMQNVVMAALGEEVSLLVGVLILSLIGSLMIVYQRLKNIGMNPWMCFLTIVPIANFWIAYRCLACQEGYAQSLTLDRAGRIISWIFGIVIVLALGALFFLASQTNL